MRPATATPADDASATVREVEPDLWGVEDDAARPLKAFGTVAGDLADMRRDARWIDLPASVVGAPHQRFVVFVLTHRPVPDPAGLGLLP
ncbi:hypothetical protein GCM10009755_15580 [Brevibacterium samyangense]|uniref:Uncharacterized protein n=1 Tax=Brevibacterium samyangense TaxID=366888 RepID=A0ABP5EW32_9MICO